MDPLSGAGLAGTVVQFIQFAANLFNVAKEIHRSATGSSEGKESLEAIYTRLSTLSTDLQHSNPANHRSNGAQPDEAVDAAMGVLAKECKTDCDRLLHVLERLNRGHGSFPKWWKSFRSALKELWKGDEIEALEARITKHQTQLIMHMCMKLSEGLQQLRVQMKQGDDHLALSLTSRHEDFWKRVKNMQTRMNEIHCVIVKGAGKVEKSAPSQEPIGSPNPESLSRQISKLTLDDMKKPEFMNDLFSERTELRELASLSEIYTKADDILETIDYEHRTARHDSIPTAYPTTFEWVLDKSNPQSGYLLEWLEKGSEIFWITGKPGAGKSTFVKFVADNLETKRALRQWAGGSKAVIGSHYFWSAGTTVQRSRDGLLRSLLHNIFYEAPELFPEVCPRRWKRASISNKASGPAWSSTELTQALFTVVKKAKASLSFCFFIDGLDEAYMKDNDTELCDTMITLSSFSNVKLCISSRPWNRFTEYFGSRPTISIHELTRNDIRHFTQHELSRHPRWRGLANEQGMRDGLIVEIVQRAQGVFLWVFLVVRELREGLTNYDTSKDLWKRLDRIPDELTMFFRLIIESVEPFYLQKMAETLLIAASGHGPLHSAIYTFHDRCDTNPSYAIEEPLVPWTDKKLEDEVRPCSMRLNSRCKGLVEVDAFDRVNFLHRTVRDFLQMEEMQAILKGHAASGFDAGLSIFQAYIFWIKHSAFASMRGIVYFGPSKSLLVDTLETALAYAGKSDSPFVLDLIDDLDWAIHRMFDTGQATFAGTETIQQTQNLFRTCILRTGLDDYSIKRLVREPQYLQGLEVPPLVSVLKLDTQDETDHEMRWSARRVNLLQSLLDHGHNPNEVYVDPESGIETTPWCELMETLIPCPQLEQDQLPSDYPHRPLMEAVSRGVISMLLDHGADPNATVEREDSPEPLEAWAKFFLACFSTPGLMLHSDQYLSDLDKIVRKASLDLSTGFLQSLGEWLIGEPIDIVCRSLGVPISLRTAVWNILGCFLRRDSAAPSKRAPKSYRELQFYAKVTKTFLRHDDLSKLPLHDIRATVQQSMPTSLVPDILEGVNGFIQSRQETRSSAKRQRPLDADGDEDMTCSPGHKAPRISFICNLAGGLPERQIGRRYGETVWA